MARNGWIRSGFQDLIDAGLLEIGDGYRAKNSELKGTGPLFLRAGHLTDTHISFDGVERFRAELADRVQTKMAMVGDTIVTTKGNSTGRTSYVTSRMPPFVYSPHLSYWRSLNHDRLVPGFLRYWSQGKEFVSQLQGMKASTDMAPYLSLTDQKRLRITLPPAGGQKTICRILCSLDDKIELNRRMNETLEAMARAIFKSWFVDFDPVRAKVEGRNSGLPKAVADLFPNRFEDSELGKIPHGWRCCRWNELATLEYGKSLREYGGASGLYRVFGTNGPIGWHDEALCPSPGVVIGRKGAYRGVHYSPEPFFVIDTAFYLKSKDSIDLKWAYYEILRLDINGMDSGSAIPSTSREDFYGILACVPPPPVQRQFGATLESLFKKKYANEHESHILAATRDALLPKLLSGELYPSECRP